MNETEADVDSSEESGEIAESGEEQLQVASTDIPSEVSTKVSADALFNGMPWHELVENLEVKGLAKELAMHCVLSELTDERAKMFINESDQQLLSDSRTAAIQSALAKYLGSDCQVNLQVANVAPESPAARRQRIEDERLAATKDSMLSSPGVNDLMSEFGASLRESSIQPATRED